MFSQISAHIRLRIALPPFPARAESAAAALCSMAEERRAVIVARRGRFARFNSLISVGVFIMRKKTGLLNLDDLGMHEQPDLAEL